VGLRLRSTLATGNRTASVTSEVTITMTTVVAPFEALCRHHCCRRDVALVVPSPSTARASGSEPPSA
jgi:hypothetical protein